MRRARLIMTIALGLALSSCIGGQVQPYERGQLADPIMSFSRDPVSDNYRRHVYETREGARGASTGQGGGCGCN